MPTNFSPELVKIPTGLDFLLDFTETGYTIQGDQVRANYPIINGIKQKRPRFTLVADAKGRPVIASTYMNEFATAFLEEGFEPNVQDNADGTKTFTDEFGRTCVFKAVSTSATKTITERLDRYMTQLVAFGGETVGMSVKQAVAYFGDDFKIQSLSYTKPNGEGSGLVYIDNADENGIINGQTTYFGYVSAARVLADCVLSNFYTYNRKTKSFTYLAGPYPWLKKDATIADLPSKVTIHTYETRPFNNSVFAHLAYEGGKVKGNVFVNKQPFTTDKFQVPSGSSITPTYVLMLTNGGPDQTAGGYVLRARAQSVAHLTSFDEYTITPLEDETKEGYIDITTKTIFINPTKKAIVRLEVTQARIGDIMGKTWSVEGAINLETGEWSKFFERL